MKQEEKELLIKDLCARLPYDVKCKILETSEIKILSSVRYDWENTLFDFWEDDRKIQYDYQLYLSEFKPYLFPLSSMTDEKCKELEEIDPEFYSLICENGEIYVSMDLRGYDWLNENHFDYRGLIPKGFAIDCTNLNIY